MASTNYYKQYDDKNLKNKEKQIATVTDNAAKNTQTITENYGAKIKEAEMSYDDQYRVNAVQKLINERQVAESMANNGLTNSGLNRTQQTAVQLSYANNKAALDRQKQSAIDALNREMNAYITDVETTAATNIASIEDTYNQNRQSYVLSREQADAEAAATIKAAQIKAASEQKLGKLKYGTLAGTAYAANGNVVYTDASGNQVTMRAGSNPFTGTVNSDLLDESGVYDPSRAFDNGYQPRYYKGNKLTLAEGNAFSPYWRVDGKSQNVFTDGTNNYVWNGTANRYERVSKTDSGEWLYIQNMVDSDCSSFTESEWRQYFASLKTRNGEDYAKSMYYALKSSNLIPTKMQNIAYLAAQGKITGH